MTWRPAGRMAGLKYRRRRGPSMEEVVRARGHQHVSAAHESTWELTADDWLTPAGDCILAVGADRAPADFDPAFVGACRDADARIVATLAVEDERTTVRGSGHPDLTFESDRSLVARTSGHVDDRTVMVGADAAAADLPRALTGRLADGSTLRCTFRVE